MEKRFNIKVNCIFNPLDKKQIINKAKNILKDKFFDQRQYLKIINIGRFTEQKDQITILRAINILKDSVKLKLIIMGRGQEKEKMIDYINEKNLNKILKIKNFSDNPYNFLKKSDIFILSSMRVFQMFC